MRNLHGAAVICRLQQVVHILICNELNGKSIFAKVPAFCKHELFKQTYQQTIMISSKLVLKDPR